MSHENYVCKMSDKGFNIWTDIVTPLIISPILLLIKILYDRFTLVNDKNTEIRNSKELDKIKHKLSDFYWPLYIRLLKDYDIWSQFLIFDDRYYDYLDNDTDSDSDMDILQRCQFKFTCTKDGINSIKYCNCPVHVNSTYGDEILCHKHRNMSSNLQIYSNCENLKEESIVITNLGGRTFAGNFSGNNTGEITGITDHTKKTKTILGSEEKKKMITEMLTNHEKIHDIILENISLGEPNSRIGQELMKYLKFISVFKGIYGKEHINPISYNAPYPKKLLPYIEKKVFSLQKKYNNLIDNFYQY